MKKNSKKKSIIIGAGMNIVHRIINWFKGR